MFAVDTNKVVSLFPFDLKIQGHFEAVSESSFDASYSNIAPVVVTALELESAIIIDFSKHAFNP